MASWLRAAEELFEVVDRTAKHVVSEQEPVPASDTLSQRKAPTTIPSKEKNIRGRSSLARVPSGALSQVNNNETVSLTKLQAARSLDKGSTPGAGQTIVKDSSNSRKSNGIHFPDAPVENGARVKSVIEVGKSCEAEEANGSFDVNGGDEHVNCNLNTENGTVTVNLYAGSSTGRLGPTAEPTAAGQFKDTMTNVEKLNDSKPSLEAKLDDQLEEANGLLQGVSSSGKSKEARLAKVCAGLSVRLQELKAENVQLEELLQLEREARKSMDTMLNEAQQDLALARSAANAVESEMTAALASKNTEIEALLVDLENVKRQAKAAEENLASVQTEMESVMKNRDITETRMIQTLRQQLASAERRAEEERAAHSSTRMAAVERETELEQRMAESTAAVMRMQRIVDERSQKAADLEQKVSILEIECAALNQELQSMESRIRREQKRQPEEISQNTQAWREEAERARLAQREAETRLAALEAECQKLRVELASTKRDSDISSTQAHMELEKRFRELTELLYLKQTQLETMASEKAAALLQLEKESNRFREAKAAMERSRRQFSAIADDDDNGLRSFESLGLQQRRIDAPSLQRIVGPSIQSAAKFLDSGAVTAGRYLWRRPFARIFVLFYLLFVHLFLMYLLHRLQEQMISSEAASAAGLLKNGA